LARYTTAAAPTSSIRCGQALVVVDDDVELGTVEVLFIVGEASEVQRQR
jgi:hypothetical protein